MQFSTLMYVCLREGINMVKKYLILLLVVCISLWLVGCGSAISDKDAKGVIKEYKSLLYNVEDYNSYEVVFETPETLLKFIEQFKPYYTEKGYAKFVANRTPLMVLQACFNGKHNLEFEDITFNKVSKKTKENKVIFDYEVKIKVTYPETNTEKIVNELGQASLVKENGNWKIDNDWVNLNEVFREDLKIKR